MHVEMHYKLLISEPEMEALYEIMAAALGSELLEGLPLAMARAFLDAANDDDEQEPEHLMQVLQ